MELDKASTMINKVLAANYCGDLFDNNEALIKEKYRLFAKVIHPDICHEQGAVEAFTKLNNLYYRALDDIKNGVWEENEVLWIPGNPKGIKYLNRKKFELGWRYVTQDSVIYIFDPGKEKYRDRFVTMARRIQYDDSKMLDKYKPKMPIIKETTPSAIYVNRLLSDDYPMDSFISAYGWSLTGRDIAWMISRMCDLLCFLHHNNIVMNSIKPENLFINPNLHTISIYGGWWYSTFSGEKLLGTTKDIYELMPMTARTNKVSDPVTDAESVRIIFRKLINGKKDIPKPIADWINAGSLGNPYEEFKRWDQALNEAYGVRKFQILTVNPDEIYKN